MIIDTHTHIYKEKEYFDYLTKAKDRISKILVLMSCEFDENELKNTLQLIESKNDLYAIGTVDINNDITERLKMLNSLFNNKKLFGIKLYPGYQYFYPSDKKVFPIAELCQKYDKPLIFHSGDVWNPKGDAMLKYSNPIHVDELAVNFPKCKIIISHFGFPYHLETANILSKNENVYTEISGTIDEVDSDKESENLLNQYIKDLLRVFSYYPNVKKKIMFGTDYGGEHTPLNKVEPYIEVVKNVFSKDEQDNVFHKLAEKLFFKD